MKKFIETLSAPVIMLTSILFIGIAIVGIIRIFNEFAKVLGIN